MPQELPALSVDTDRPTLRERLNELSKSTKGKVAIGMLAAGTLVSPPVVETIVKPAVDVIAEVDNRIGQDRMFQTGNPNAPADDATTVAPERTELPSVENWDGTYTAGVGDTLWGMAKDTYPENGNLQADFVEKLKPEITDGPTAGLDAGEQVPIETQAQAEALQARPLEQR